MVSKVAAAIVAALGLTASAPAPHVVYSAPKKPHAKKAALPVLFVSGHGWGHGVGLAQYGAYGYALHGWTFDKIVAHYYPGTDLGPAPVKRVRVLLAPHLTRAVVSSAAPFTVVDGNGKSHKLSAGAQALGPGLKVTLSAGKKAKALPGPLLFSPGTAPLALGGRGYRGSLRVKTAGSSLEVVNLVGLEPYLWGVVPSEMPNRWPAEALAAQAVVARTYALAHLQKGGDFDLYPDTRSQVYGGIGAEALSSTAAVNETAGQVVLYDGELADTFFSSSSGGKTANVQDVWTSPPVPYLVSVPDPYDTLSPYHNWGPLRFSGATIARRFHVPGQVLDFRANVAASGRVRTLTFVGTKGEKTVAGSTVRAALGLRSTWFHFGLISLSPAGPATYGSPLTLAGVARGAPKVYLESRPLGGSWKSLGRLSVKNGAVSPKVKPTITTDYRLQSGGFLSAIVRVAVAPLVTLVAGADGVSVSGVVKPISTGETVDVQRLDTDGWTSVATATPDSSGNFQATIDLQPGSYRAKVAAARGYAAGFSKTLTVVAP
jgi:stage II sporulation protein D